MKKINTLLAVICLLATLSLRAQYVNIPDANLATWLQSNGYSACVTANGSGGWHMDTTCAAVVNCTTLIIHSNTTISNSDGLQYFPNLTTLEFSSTSALTTIPALPRRLTSLVLYTCPNVHTLPVLPSGLTTLHIHQATITSFPAWPSTLTTLLINQTNNTVIPSLPPTLTYLDLSGNTLITSIPALPSTLLTLYCSSDNSLTSLPALPSSLQYLDCSSDPLITTLPALPSTLYKLICFSSNINSLPTLPSNLAFLECNNNPLTSLPALPNNLIILYCTYCNLTALPAFPPHLDSLYCDHNQITNIPAAPHSLDYISCTYNRLTSITSLSSYMKVLDCSNNQMLTCLPAIDTITDRLQFDSTGIQCLSRYPIHDNSWWYFGMSPSINSTPLCSAGNINGCPLTTCPPINTYLSDSIAFNSPYIFNGNTLTQAGNYTAHIFSVGGCDSTLHLSLSWTRASHITATKVAAICMGNSFTWHGHSFTQTTTYKDTVILSGGQDSVTTLYLTVDPVPVISLTQSGSICPGPDTLRLSTATTEGNMVWSQNGTSFRIDSGNAIIMAGNNGRGSAANQFSRPTGVYLDNAGSIYVSDGDNNRIQKFPASSTSATNGVTVAGGMGIGSAANQLSAPNNIYVDASGNIYVCDASNNRVQKFPAGSTSGINATTVAGGNGAGSAANQLRSPSALAFDASGNMYVADPGNSRVQKFPAGSTSSTNGVTVAGGNGSGSALNQVYPTGLAFDASGYLYVADYSNSRVLKFPAGSTSATNGVISAGGNGNGAAANQLVYAGGIFIDAAGYLYVNDYYGQRIQKFPPGSTSATSGITIAGGHGAGFETNQLYNSQAMYVDAGGSVYVAELGSHRIDKWRQNVLIPQAVTSGGTYQVIETNSYGCTDTASVIVVPCSAAAGPDRTICPYDATQPSATGTGTWTALSSNPLTTTIANPTSPITVISGFNISGVYGYKWTTPGGIDTMYVTVNPKPNAGPDRSLPCITLPGGSTTMAAVGTGSWAPWSMNADTAHITTPNSPTTTISNFPIGGNFQYIWTSTLGCTDTATITVSEGAPTPTLTSLGTCLGYDTLQISGAHTALAYTWYLNGSPIEFHQFPAFTIAGGNGPGSAANQFSSVTDIHRDAFGNLYVLDRDNNRVQKFPPSSGSSTNGVTIAGGNGQGAAANQMVEPEGMFITASGDIYIADTYMNRIQKFPAGSTSSTNATTVAGGNGPGSAANKLTAPYGVYVDSVGNLYVADEGNDRIQKFPAGSTSATNAVTVAGTGTSGSGATQLNSPFGITVSGNGTMYVSDAGNHRIQKFPSGSTAGMPATTVAGGNGQGSAANQLDYPHNVFVNTNGDLYIADMSNQRIQKFPAGSSSATNGVTVAGGNGRDTSANQLSSPTRVIRDTAGYLYIADEFNHRVQKWTGSQTDSLIMPTAPGTYTATATMYSGCVSPVSNSVFVNYCLSDSVWPGDADHNGLADNNDLLPLGTAYGLNGILRTNQSIVWTAHYAQDWGVQFLNGTNTKHADCNGDGVINANDTTAILLNFGLTHAKTDGYGAPWRSGIPGITLHYSKDTVQAGDTLTVSVLLGDSNTTVSNIYGLAFTYHYDAVVVDTTTTRFNFINSFLANSSNGMSISRESKTDGTVKAAVTGINHTNRSGYGEIARFIATITTGNINGKDLAYYRNVNYITDIRAIDKDEAPITLNAGVDSNEVEYEPTGIREAEYARVLIYPNPTKDAFTIKADIQAINTEYTLTDVTGRAILTGKLKGGEAHVSIADLASGVYMLRFADQKQSYKVTKY